MPRLVQEGQTCDNAIAQMARTSYAEGTQKVNDDRTLIRHLMRHKHTSPFEGVVFKFFVKLPLFVQGQFVRHRTFSLNQESARYSVMKDEFYIPKNIRTQSKNNKQGSEITLSETESLDVKSDIGKWCEDSYKLYQEFLEQEVTREQARMILPQNLYTSCIYKMDLHNLLHFLSLRCDGHAQWEIRQYADAILELITPLIPWTIEAWNEYHPLRNATTFTAKELKKISEILTKINNLSEVDLNSGNKREDSEWLQKLSLLIKN